MLSVSLSFNSPTASKLGRLAASCEEYRRVVDAWIDEDSQVIGLDTGIKALATLRGKTVLVLEDLTGITKNNKLKGRLSKNMRSVIGKWQVGGFHRALRKHCALNRVWVVAVSPRDTSRTCYACGYTDKGNRKGETFCCLRCSHGDNADANASKNIESRGIKYLRSFHSRTEINFSIGDLN